MHSRHAMQHGSTKSVHLDDALSQRSPHANGVGSRANSGVAELQELIRANSGVADDNFRPFVVGKKLEFSYG